jgi:hypothetical protein
MYKKILGKIRELFFKEQGYEVSLRRQCILDEYKDIYVQTREAKNLTELLHTRKLIRDFQQGIIDVKEESWARQYLMDLTRVWRIKYNLWKRNRGRDK